MDCGDTAPSSLSVVFPGQLLLSQGKFLGYRCDLRRLFTGSLCSLEFSTLYLQFSSRRHCWQHLVRSVFLVLLWKISWTFNDDKTQVKVPVFTLPFTLSTLLIVMGWNEQGQKWKYTNMNEYISARRQNILGI